MANIYVTESQFKQILSESLKELTAYHGSAANFDKFDHKHYLSTGCGSQVFGWGTYVTDDYAIADSYASSAQKEIELPKYEGKDIDGAFFTRLMFNMTKDAMDRRYIYDIARWLYEELMAKYNGLFSKFKQSENRKFEMFKKHHKDALVELEKVKSGEEKLTSVNSRRVITALKAKLENDAINSVDEAKWENSLSSSYIYEVDIPDDNGSNYIEWYEHLPNEFMVRILHGLLRLKPKYLEMMAKHDYGFRSNIGYYLNMREHPNFEKMINLIASEDDYHTFLSSGLTTEDMDGSGKNVYHALTRYMGSPKAASLFLLQCGFTGIKYPTGTRCQKPTGASEEGKNYVIFNANDVKITKKEGLGFDFDNITL